MKTAPKKRVYKSKKADYTASIKVFGKVYTSTGSTAREAITNLKVGSVARGVSILSVSKKGNMHTKILNTVQTSRLFSLSTMMREIALKQVALIFEGI